jgi:signal transduction histidine kinase
MFQNKNIAAVRNNTIFKGVSETNLNFNFNVKDFQELGEGEIIYQSGDPSDYLYLLIEGEIKLKIPGGVSSPLILRKSNNDFFGEKEVQENTVRKSSAVADKNSLLYRIRKNDITSMIQRSKELRYNLSGDRREEYETDGNKKETVFDGLLGKLSEQSFFKSDNNEAIETPNLTEQKIIEEEVEVETNYGADLINEAKVPELSENKNEPEADNDSVIKNRVQTNTQLIEIINALQKIFSDLNPENIFNSIPESIAELLNAEKATLFTINTDTNELKTRKKSGTVYSDYSLKLAENLYSESIYEKRIVILTNPTTEQLAFVYPTSDETIKNLLISPINNNEDKVIGVLQLINCRKEEFDQEDEKLISELSPILALAIENSLQVRELKNSDRLLALNNAANFLIQDIKDPIITIKQYSEHIKKQAVTKDINPVLDMIIEQANCVVDFVQTTLGYTEGKVISNPQPTLLTNALNYILARLAEYVESRNVKLFKKFEGDGLVNLDKKEFYQALFQIAKNACDAMPNGGNFYITTKREGDKIRIELRDNGLGIPDSIKNRIFEPFLAHGKKQSSGLGLAITEKIITEHNGTIRAQGNIGEGAVFIIDLPVLE